MELYYILSMERVGRAAAWWKPGEWGYTDVLQQAGKFSRERAFDICRQAMGQDVPVPVEAMEVSFEREGS